MREPDGYGPAGTRALRLGFWIGGAVVVGLALPWACATPGSPSGGPRDEIPPMIESTWPDTFEVIEPTRDPVVIRFNERISESPIQGTLNAAVLVSPETGRPRVKHTRSGLEIQVIGGFQPGLVYRVRVLPTIKDMFNNPMEGPFELVFSTGGEFEQNVLAGMVTDRITGNPVRDARVEARVRGVEDAPVYVATTDTAGIYALRYLPTGDYDVTLFEDVNRNGQPDFRELQGASDGSLGLQPPLADTVIREISLLRPDTTPAALMRAEASDSTVLRLSFDDYLVPEGPLDQVAVRLTREEEDGPAVDRVLWEHQWDSLRAFNDSVRAEEERLAMVDSLQVVADSLQVVLDSLQAAGDSTATDTLSVRLDAIRGTISPPEPQEQPPPAPARAPPPILPQQFFFVLLAEPMLPEELYHLIVAGVENINSLGGGGGESDVTWTPPEPRGGETAQDTAQAAADTSAVRPDTSGVGWDTSVAFPDPAGGPPPWIPIKPLKAPRQPVGMGP